MLSLQPLRPVNELLPTTMQVQWNVHNANWTTKNTIKFYTRAFLFLWSQLLQCCTVVVIVFMPPRERSLMLESLKWLTSCFVFKSFNFVKEERRIDDASIEPTTTALMSYFWIKMCCRSITTKPKSWTNQQLRNQPNMIQ